MCSFVACPDNDSGAVGFGVRGHPADALAVICDAGFQADYLSRKTDRYCSDYKKELYTGLLSDRLCQNVIRGVTDGTYEFSVPEKRLISRYKIGKKRTVYTFNQYEMMALRLVNDAMRSYDHLFSPGLYSFRTGHGIRDAMRVLRGRDISSMWGIKVDIHNYFNSIPADRILEDLDATLDNERLSAFFRAVLADRRAVFKGEIIEEDKGIMAGIPISAFLANFYLRDLDSEFYGKSRIYMRYADDILMFADSEEEIMKLRRELVDSIQSMGLEMNPKKERMIRPGESFDFLGFSITPEGIGISEATVRKTKGKISRSARRIRRWMLSKNAPLEGTLRAWFNDWNDMFLGYDDSELSWSRWFMPVIDRTEGLHQIDEHIQLWARYIPNGRHCKKDYGLVTYQTMKRCGYRSLVSEYYDLREVE